MFCLFPYAYTRLLFNHRLTSYRILQNITTSWCPDREEHGYMYVPAFKCSTNPRIATAHRWNKIDVLGRLSKPTGKCELGFSRDRTNFSPIECFYNKDGVWYYAGSYKAFMLDYLSVKEWEQLPAEVRSLYFSTHSYSLSTYRPKHPSSRKRSPHEKTQPHKRPMRRHNYTHRER